MVFMVLEGMSQWDSDLTILIGAFSTYTFFLLVYNLLKHMKNGGSFLTAKGIILFITSLGVLQGVLTFQVNFSTYLPLLHDIIGKVAVFFFIAGMVGFIILAEIDMVRHEHRSGIVVKKYRLSFLAFAIIAITPFLSFILFTDLGVYYLYIIYALIVPIFFYSSIKFIRSFARMRIVQNQRPVRWIISGFAASFLGLLLYNGIFWKPPFDEWVMPVLTSGSMLLGGIFMYHGWEHMPNLSELSWLSSLESLYVIYAKDGIVLFQYPFQYDKTPNLVKNDADLVGGMIGALDDFIHEALSTQKHLTEIKIEGKIVSCTYRRFCAFVVFATSVSEESQSRLYEFADDFEKIFAKKLKGAYNIAMYEYKKADPLVAKHFS